MEPNYCLYKKTNRKTKKSDQLYLPLSEIVLKKPEKDKPG